MQGGYATQEPESVLGRPNQVRLTICLGNLEGGCLDDLAVCYLSVIIVESGDLVIAGFVHVHASTLQAADRSTICVGGNHG